MKDSWLVQVEETDEVIVVENSTALMMAAGLQLEGGKCYGWPHLA